jgi:hypothetical protein
MSRLRSIRFAIVTSLAFGALTLSSCGGSSDQTTSFVGPWTFASGTLTPTMCPFAVPSFDLAGLNVDFTKVNDSTIRLTLNAGCVVDFNVSGGKGTVAANQTCGLDVGPPLNMVAVSIQTWTLSLMNDHIDCTIAGSASICSAIGTATLVRGTTDGGPRDAPGRETTGETGGASDGGAGTDTSEGGAAEAGGDTSSLDTAGETAPEGGAETGVEVGAEAGAETGAEVAADAPAAETD